ncbi:unnamed protein product [Polarella glacialis]|uniref:Uncharacterized protein n=1 Tax=Polarella glacialis TaxID=89957 RepID=A0A813F2J9_POLGL|nr:unnamed protein product [Polarella glacialis]
MISSAYDKDTHSPWECDIPKTWPNSGSGHEDAAGVRSLRLFKAWSPAWPPEGRLASWKRLVKYIHQNDVLLLLGTSISCDVESDKQQWEWAKELMKMVGKRHILALAIGNEVEYLHEFRFDLNISDECLDRVWKDNYAFNWFNQVVSEVDEMGFQAIPITTVFGGLSLNSTSEPFRNIPHGQVNTFMSQAVEKYQKRFVFTFNLYAYFDPFLRLDNGTEDQCTEALAEALCWRPECILPQAIAAARRKLTNLTGDPNWSMWIGETGWASHVADSLRSDMSHCLQWSSMDSFKESYRGFLDWNLSISNVTSPLAPPEHVFYFTVHNSQVRGFSEYFGLVPNCGDRSCKIV